jgi:Autographiviridae endonuclease VII
MPHADPIKAREYRKQYYEKNRERHAASTKRWYLANPDKKRLSSWREKDIRMTLKQFNQMLESQNHQCRICGRPDKGYKKKLAVDHDHETGLVRGLLCGACNTAIGLLKDDWILFETAANYLRSFNA